MSTTTASRSLKEKQREERERLILSAAEALLVEKGYHETSIDEIALRVGISKGTVYLHFPSKEELVFALLGRDSRAFQEKVQEVYSSAGSSRSKLTAILHAAYGGLLGKNFPYLAAIFQSTEIRNRLVEKKQALQSNMEKMLQLITAIVDDGKQNGEFDPSIPSVVMVSAFTNMFSPHNFERLIIKEGLPTDEVVGHLSQIYFCGIVANAPQERDK